MSQETDGLGALIAFAFVGLLVLTCVGFYGCPKYRVWQQGQEGEAKSARDAGLQVNRWQEIVTSTECFMATAMPSLACEPSLEAIRSIRDRGLSAEIRRTNGAYLNAFGAAENEVIKQPQRERVLAHLLKYHCGDRLSLLSMPGVYWRFEHMVADEWSGKPSYFLGFDWNWGIIEKGFPWMPGERKVFRDYELAIGSVQAVQSTCAKWLHADAGHFMSLERNEKKSNGGWRQRFAYQFKRNTCIWLDLNSNFSESTRRCLECVQSHCWMECEVVPIAVTIVAGQEWDGLDDGPDPISRRLRPMERLLGFRKFRSFETTDAWMYRSAHGQNMMTVLGLLRRK